MKLDIFNHIFPKQYYDLMLEVAPNYKDMGKRVREVPMLYDLDERFRGYDFGIDGKRLRQHLDGYVALQVGVVGAVHLPHAAGAQRLDDLVFAQRLADQRQKSHAPPMRITRGGRMSWISW